MPLPILFTLAEMKRPKPVHVSLWIGALAQALSQFLCRANHYKEAELDQFLYVLACSRLNVEYWNAVVPTR